MGNGKAWRIPAISADSVRHLPSSNRDGDLLADEQRLKRRTWHYGLAKNPTIHKTAYVVCSSCVVRNHVLYHLVRLFLLKRDRWPKSQPTNSRIRVPHVSLLRPGKARIRNGFCIVSQECVIICKSLYLYFFWEGGTLFLSLPENPAISPRWIRISIMPRLDLIICKTVKEKLHRMFTLRSIFQVALGG
jgi:hypothetical protein